MPLVVAVNKIDKPEADPDRVKTELARYNVMSEDWGGDCQFVHVSAKSGEGIDDLLEAIPIQAEVLELKAVVDGMANGVVIESFLDKGRIRLPPCWYRKVLCVRATSFCVVLSTAGCAPCVTNWVARSRKQVPLCQWKFWVCPAFPLPVTKPRSCVTRRKPVKWRSHRQGKFRESQSWPPAEAKLENMFANMTEGEVSEVNVVIKADVQGSVEAICDALVKLSTDEVKVKIVVPA